MPLDHRIAIVFQIEMMVLEIRASHMELLWVPSLGLSRATRHLSVNQLDVCEDGNLGLTSGVSGDMLSVSFAMSAANLCTSSSPSFLVLEA